MSLLHSLSRILRFEQKAGPKRLGSKRKLPRKLFLEPLEDRRLLTTYTYVDLIPLNGALNAGAAGIQLVPSQPLQMVGWSWQNAQATLPIGALWTYNTSTKNLTVQGLPLLRGGNNGYAYAINNGSVISGDSSYNNQGVVDAVTWYNGTITDLGTLGGGAEAYALNNNGWVVGQSGKTPANTVLPFLWTATTGIQALPTLASGADGTANGVNDPNGTDPAVIVGDSHTGSANQYYHAVLWDGSTHSISDLGTLGGNNSEAQAINASDQIVGWSNDPNANQHAFLYQNGTMTDISAGGVFWAANAINSQGVIVGTGNDDAYLYSGGTAVNLNTETNSGGWTLTDAYGIDNNGDIVGSATKQISPGHWVDHGFLLVPNGSSAPAAFAPGITTTSTAAQNSDKISSLSFTLFNPMELLTNHTAPNAGSFAPLHSAGQSSQPPQPSADRPLSRLVDTTSLVLRKHPAQGENQFAADFKVLAMDPLAES